jgi:hypothetical protein
MDPPFLAKSAGSTQVCSLAQQKVHCLNASDLIGSLIAIAGGMVAVWGITRMVRYQSKLVRSRNWPVVPGTVQRGEILQKGATTFLKVPFRSLLGYAYRVDGRPYWGLFALIAEDRETAEKLQSQAEGTPVAVRYNPKAPEVSILEDRVLLGRRVIQDPMYLDNSD